MQKKSTATARFVGREAQPIFTVQWIHRERLHANDYNPNHQAPTERKLLRLSLLKTGWTQPIVARECMTIVDGFHRWSISEDPAVYEMTDGFLPVVVLPASIPLADLVAATIRHNRARGSHGILPMADIVRDLVDNHNVAPDDVQEELGMDDEEFERLYDRGSMPDRVSRVTTGFNPSWEPGATKKRILIDG